MSELFFGLSASDAPGRWTLPVRPKICVGRPGQAFMYGGVGLGSAMTAIELTTGRRAVWATAQFLDYARPGSLVEIEVTTLAQGKYNTQATARLSVDGREIIVVSSALSARTGEISGQWRSAPTVPTAHDPYLTETWEGGPGPLYERFEWRRVTQAPRDTHLQVWARPREITPLSVGILATLADIAPQALAWAVGRETRGNSLDNTLRIHRLVDTEWVLLDVRISGLDGGIAHGEASIFSTQGVLMATASQSFIARTPALAEICHA